MIDNKNLKVNRLVISEMQSLQSFRMFLNVEVKGHFQDLKLKLM